MRRDVRSGELGMPEMSVRLVVCVVVLALCSGCGYLRAGKWEDDPRNWGRAFKSEKPPGVTVVHSLYWRAPHWTWEGGYLFQIEPNPAFKAELFSRNRLERASTVPLFLEKPAWFAPKPPTAYEVWCYADEPRGHFRVLIDLETGSLFLCDYQV